MRLNRPPNKRINVRSTWKCQSQDSSTAELLGKWGLPPWYAVGQEVTLNYCVFDKTRVWCVKSTSSDPHTIREGYHGGFLRLSRGHVPPQSRPKKKRAFSSCRCRKTRFQTVHALEAPLCLVVNEKKQRTKHTSTAWHDSELWVLTTASKGYWSQSKQWLRSNTPLEPWGDVSHPLY